MGFFKKLFGIGAVAGTTVAAVKVAEKVKANNPEGMDANADGKVDAKEVFDEVVKAAGEVYQETAEVVKEKAGFIKEKAPDVVEKAQQAMGSVSEKAQQAMGSVSEKAQQAVDSLKADFGKVVDETTPEAEVVAAEEAAAEQPSEA